MRLALHLPADTSFVDPLKHQVRYKSLQKRLSAVIRRNPLVDLLFVLKGNPKVCVFMEPLWGIPNGLIAPFATLYMYAMGVGDVQIGLILSISLVAQMFFSLSGGIITDKFGRKNTTVLADAGAWVVATLIWAVSQNFWFFLVAALANSIDYVNRTAWACLLIEDAEEKHILDTYTLITIAGLMCVFFAPLSGVLIEKFSLVPVVRILYLIFAAMMAIKTFVTFRYTIETRQGAIRRAATKKTSVLRMIGEYRHIVPLIFKNKATLQTLAIMLILNITSIVFNSFLGLYVNISQGIAER
jgi:MFS family permease